MTSDQADDDYYRRFVATFTPDNFPTYVWFTGGEPMLRPALVRELATSCHGLGATTVLTTGLYFGRNGTIPSTVWHALDEIDYVTVSVDRWHEEEISRQSSFACFQQMLSRGLEVGIQATVTDRNDPYLSDLLSDVRARFDDQIEVFVSLLGPVGRGASLVGPGAPNEDAVATGPPRPQGCGGLSWPVFGLGGTTANACCNQDAINQRAEHLRLPIDWPGITKALREDPVLRVINVLGPRVLAYNLGLTNDRPMPYCYKCHTLAGRDRLAETAEQILSSRSWPIVERTSATLRQQIGDPTLSIPELSQYGRGSGGIDD